MPILPGWDSLEMVQRLSKFFTIAGFVSLFFLGVFEVLAYIYGNRREDLLSLAQSAAAQQRWQQQEKEKQEKDNQLAEMKKKVQDADSTALQALNGQAAAKKEIAELKEHAAPRILTGNQKTAISSFLSNSPTGAITLKANVTVADARSYADEIAGLLRSAGWTVRVDNAIITGPNARGLWITVKNPQAAPVAAVSLQRAFAAANMNVRAEYDPTMPDSDEVWLSVGAK